MTAELMIPPLPDPLDDQPREELVHEIPLPEPPAPGAHMRRAVPGDIPAILRARRLTEERLEGMGIQQWPVGDLTDEELRSQIDRGLWYVMVRDTLTEDGTDPIEASSIEDRAGRTVRGGVTGGEAELPPAQAMGHAEQLLATVSWHEEDPAIWPDATPGEARYLHGFMTNPESGVRGAGAQVLQWAAERTRREGVRLLRLDCLASNESLLRMYLSRGFTRVGTYENPQHWYVGALLEKEV